MTRLSMTRLSDGGDHIGTDQIRCDNPGHLPMCASCKFDCRSKVLPRADERQQWFSPRNGIVTCGSYEGETVQ